MFPSRLVPLSRRAAMWSAMLVLVACNGGGGGSAPVPAPVAVADAYVFPPPAAQLAVVAPGVLSNDSGAPTTAVLVGAPAHAAAFTLNADGSFTYRSNNGTSSDTFSYRATNASGSSGVVVVSLEPNQPPAAVNACLSTPIDTSVNGTLTATDEPASQPGTEYTLITDPIGPNKGTVNVSINGSFSYTPINPSYVGMDKFKFQVTDKFGLTDTGIATILINGAVRIMPLGDSITQGIWYGGLCGDPDGNCPASNQRIGYRKKLLDELEALSPNYAVDMIGSLANGSAAGLAPPDDRNEGHPGWCAGSNGSDPAYCSSRSIASNVFNWLTDNQPDIVLLHAGTNAFTTNASDVATLLDNINIWAAANYPVKVFVARIIKTSQLNGATSDTNINTFNNNVATNVTNAAATRPALGVYMVDQQDGASLIYIKDTGADCLANGACNGDLADDLHPNPSGYNKMAAKWRTDLVAAPDVLPTCP